MRAAVVSSSPRRLPSCRLPHSVVFVSSYETPSSAVPCVSPFFTFNLPVSAACITYSHHLPASASGLAVCRVGSSSIGVGFSIASGIFMCSPDVCILSIRRVELKFKVSLASDCNVE
ncbi:hypothetical protein LINPERHAP2_LOCUS6753 [Linum perenne]